jgi:uncharacterized RDD family membrane protein YckC
VPAPSPRSSPPRSRFGRRGDPAADAIVGRRIVAGLIDLMLVTTVVIAVFRAGNDTALTPTASLVFSLITLVYYFAGEVAAGQTLGKHLLGIEVRRTDGTRADATRIAVRTLMRLVDWIPTLYGLGLAVMASTRRRQRLGDVLAGTVVVRRGG